MVRNTNLKQNFFFLKMVSLKHGLWYVHTWNVSGKEIPKEVTLLADILDFVAS